MSENADNIEEVKKEEEEEVAAPEEELDPELLKLHMPFICLYKGFHS